MAKVIKPKRYNVTVRQTITIQKKFTAWKPEQALEKAYKKAGGGYKS